MSHQFKWRVNALPGRPLSFRVKGRVIDAASGQALTRVKVALLTTRAENARVIAQAVTERRGQFEADIAATEFTSAPARARLLKGFIRIEALSGQVLLKPKAFELQPGVAVTIAVQLPTEALTPALWQTVAQRMRDARLVRLNEVVAQLLDTTIGANPFDGLGLAVRYQAAAVLEQAFVDPTGRLRAAGVPTRLSALADRRTFEGSRAKLAGDAAAIQLLEEAHSRALAFEQLAMVDWVLDPDALAEARVGDAVMMFQSVYTESLSNADSALRDSPAHQAMIKVYPPSDLSRYRDYLLAIFTGPQGANEFSARREKLRTRFHQTFSGNNSTPRVANRLLHGIVTEILKAPTGAGYGFGIAPRMLPVQGNQTDREYLDALVALSGVTKKEFSLRYRLNLNRPDWALSSVVEEHIITLQGFYTDGFQSVADLHPVIPQPLLGKAPFFLFYTEWLRGTGTFHAENFFQLDRCFGLRMPASLRESLLAANESDEDDPDRKWIITLVKAEAAYAEGRQRFGQMQYVMAAEEYAKAMQNLNAALQYLSTSGNVGTTLAAFAPQLEYWRSLPMDTPEDLDAFTDYVVPSRIPEEDPISPQGEFTLWILDHRENAQLYLCHLAFVVLPVAQGDAALAQGDFAQAVAFYELTTRFLLGRANESLPTGWVHVNWGEYISVPEAEQALGGASANVRGALDDLPYTAAREPDDPILTDILNSFHHDLKLAFLEKLHPMERRFLKLRHADAMLEWADMLYRTDEPSCVQRAREVYKAVLFLHSTRVGISPRWNSPQLPVYRQHDANPAWVSQTARATAAVIQIAHGLNGHGLADGVVPSLRYRTLKETADRFAAAARSAQQDFLAYLGKIEEAIKDEILFTNMLKRARLQGELAAEQAKIAGVALAMAKAQVAEVEKAIEEKKKEIEENDDFFNQFVGFIGGMVTSITDLPSGLTSTVGGGAAVAGGLSTAEGATLTGAAAGSAALAGYGLFVYAGYTSLSGLEEQHDTLHGQLNALEDKALPLTKQQAAVRESEVAIANLQGQIALADGQLAIDLMHFQSVRFLNGELWAQLAGVVKRLMRRYLALGARFAWLAERAIAFEQNRTFNIVRLDYFPRKLQGISGADLLQADLAELEAARLDGLRRMVPIRRTFSLQFDFPVQYAQLLATGGCVFSTAELPLRREHPGTYGHRIVTVALSFGGASGLPPVRGLLTNSGISAVSLEDGSSTLFVRAPESLPLSELRSAERGWSMVSEESLGTFEGTGIETQWTLEVPPAGNPSGLDGLADVQVTFDLRSHHSSVLMAQDLAAMPTTIRRFVFLSLAAFQADQLDLLRSDPPSVTFQIALGPGLIPSWHSGATLHNVVVLFASLPPPSLQASLAAVGTDIQASFQATNGVALSNLPPVVNTPPDPASPLNVFDGLPATQPFVLTVNSADNPGMSFATLKDIVLGLEYEAALPMSS